mmetsp:Transcript_62412/g.115868  ORF Transcript_62412/g.115868 Transcript_62412/m.115868 type:complete len:482 (+) Transcript_62412:65-1510(+)
MPSARKGQNNNVRAEPQEPELTFSLHSDADSRFTAARIVPGTSQVVTGGSDGAVIVWPISSSGPPRPLRLGKQKGPVTCVTASTSGGIVASASMDRSVVIWSNRARKRENWPVKLHFSPVRSCDISADERFLLTASDDKTVKMSSMSDLRFLRSMVGHSHWVRSAVFAPSAEFCASAGDDRTVRLWDSERSSQLHAWYDHSDVINCVRFDASGLALAACSSDSAINMWDVRARTLRQHYSNAHDGAAVMQVAFHPEGGLLLSAAADATVRIWDLRAGRLQALLRGHSKSAHSCDWDPQGGSFLSADSQNVHMWAWRPPQGLSAAVATNPTAVQEDAALARSAAVGDSSSSRELSQEVSQVHQATSVQLPEEGYPPLPLELLRRASGCKGAVGPSPDTLPAPVMQATDKGAAMHEPVKPSNACGKSIDEAIAPIAEQMVAQMAVLTRSLQAIEGRLSSTETAVAELSSLMRARRDEAARAGA